MIGWFKATTDQEDQMVVRLQNYHLVFLACRRFLNNWTREVVTFRDDKMAATETTTNREKATTVWEDKMAFGERMTDR